MDLETAKEKFEDRSETKKTWISNNKLHVKVEGRSYPGISSVANEIDNLKQVNHDQAEYSGEIRHYVYAFEKQ